jgi:uncharacterized membrane protein YcaP (DUF421 family)
MGFDFKDTPRVVFATVLSLVALFILAKIMGNRQMSQLSMFDYVNGITIGSIGAEMTFSEDFISPLIAMIIYALSTVLISTLASKSVKHRRFFNGVPLVLFHNDKFNLPNLKKSRLDMNELISECRTQGYFNFKDIQTVILEANGKVSVLQKSTARTLNPKDMGIVPTQEMNPIDLIINGEVLHDNLKYSGKNIEWLRKQLSQQKINSPKDVLLGYIDETNELTVFCYDR